MEHGEKGSGHTDLGFFWAKKRRRRYFSSVSLDREVVRWWYGPQPGLNSVVTQNGAHCGEFSRRKAPRFFLARGGDGFDLTGASFAPRRQGHVNRIIGMILSGRGFNFASVFCWRIKKTLLSSLLLNQRRLSCEYKVTVSPQTAVTRVTISGVSLSPKINLLVDRGTRLAKHVDVELGGLVHQTSQVFLDSIAVLVLLQWSRDSR